MHINWQPEVKERLTPAMLEMSHGAAAGVVIVLLT